MLERSFLLEVAAGCAPDASALGHAVGFALRSSPGLLRRLLRDGSDPLQHPHPMLPLGEEQGRRCEGRHVPTGASPSRL